MVVDILRRRELISDRLKLPREIWLCYSGGKCGGIAEQQTFIFMKLDIRQESNVGPKIRHLSNDIRFYGLLYVKHLFDTSQVGWNRHARKIVSQAIEI